MNIEKQLYICTRCKTQSREGGCLEKCQLGVNAVCSPEGKWFEKLTFDHKDLLEMELKS